jgi:hypothetical protein
VYCGGGGETVMCARARKLLLFPYFLFDLLWIFFNQNELSRDEDYRAIKWTCQYIRNNLVASLTKGKSYKCVCKPSQVISDENDRTWEYIYRQWQQQQ